MPVDGSRGYKRLRIFQNITFFLEYNINNLRGLNLADMISDIAKFIYLLLFDIDPVLNGAFYHEPMSIFRFS